MDNCSNRNQTFLSSKIGTDEGMAIRWPLMDRVER